MIFQKRRQCNTVYESLASVFGEGSRMAPLLVNDP